MDTTTPTMISKYRILRVLGRGGMGEVLLAEDDLGRRVAIKRSFLTASGDGLARFKVEARAATLSHPNIPVVYEMGTQEDGLPFIAMEFVEGEPLDKLISAGGPLSLLQKLSIVEQVCAGLGYAHAKGIIHRDIKPANIIVLPNGVAKIIDFGIAKITNVEQTSDLTQASQVIGSLHYIAPERFKAEAMDGRADIFSVGVILYLMLTGSLPFAGGEMTASYRIVNEAHTSLAKHIKDYPPALDAIMDQALAKNPDDRFFTAEDFADALKEVIDDLKRHRITELFGDAERLTVESRFEPALELLDEAIKLDSGNTQVRKLRRMVRDHQERRRKQDRLQELIGKAESLLAMSNYGEALAQLKEAQRLDAGSVDLQDRINLLEAKKLQSERSAEALAQVEASRNRGDITAALSIAENAVQHDPENTRLLAVRAAIKQQFDREALQQKAKSVLDAAQQEFGRRNFAAMEALLDEASALDAAHPRIETLRMELSQLREAEDRQQLVEEVRRRVNEFLIANQYEQASDLLNRAIEKVPAEGVFHRLKMEVDSAARQFDSDRFVESAISRARETFAVDPEKAIAELQSSTEQMPGNERLIAYEQLLREQANTQRVQRVLNDTLRSARQMLGAQQPDKAIATLEAFQFEHGTQPDVDELLVLAQQEHASQRLRTLVEKTSGEARELVRKDQLDDAVRLLESALQDPAIKAVGDTTLTGLLDNVRKQQAAAAQRLQTVRSRAETLRERGQLDQAIEVLTEFTAANPRSTAVQSLLASLTAEREHKQVVEQGVTAALKQGEAHQFTQAFETLKGVARAYGDSDELTAASQRIEAIRSSYANEVVGHAITTSRAALLKNDVAGSLEALRTSSEMVEYAEPARQTDWRRIGQAAKKAQAEPPAEGAVIADPLADIADASPQRKQSASLLIGGAVALCLLLVVVGVLIFRKPAVKELPNEAHVGIAKVPAGALVSIDGGAKKVAGADGTVTLPVVPGQHLLEVSKDGYDPYTEKFQVAAGETYREAVLLVKQPLASKSGTLAMRSNIAGFRVTVDGRSRGEILAKDGTLTLEEGSHTVRYSNEDNSDSQEHTIQIAAGKATADAVSLKPAAPPAPVVAKDGGKAPAPAAMGSLAVETTPNTQVAIDGQVKGSTDGAGKLTVGSLTAGVHTVDLNQEKFTPVSGRQVTIAANSTARFAQPLTPLPPSAGSISIATNAGAEISLNNQRKGLADGSGQYNLEGIPPGSYQVDITLNHFQPTRQSVTVRPGSNATLSARLQPEAVAAAPAAAKPAPEPEKPREADHTADYQGIQAALNNFEAAYRSRNVAAVQAAWTNIGAARSKSLSGALQSAEVVNISEKCEGQPLISGDTATQTCVESLQLLKSDPARKSTKTITFAKSGGKWVMKDKNP